jgi:hypothetical protein
MLWMIVLAAYFAVGFTLILVGPAARASPRTNKMGVASGSTPMDTETAFALDRAWHPRFLAGVYALGQTRSAWLDRGRSDWASSLIAL